MTGPLENSISHSYQIKVEKEHLDALNHVNNVVYVQWVQDASEKHWGLLSNAKISAKYFWVCLRHEIDYKGQAFLGDELKVLTWVGESKGVTSIRYVQILKNDKIIAQAASTWCLIDATTLKPTRIPQEVFELLS